MFPGMLLVFEVIADVIIFVGVVIGRFSRIIGRLPVDSAPRRCHDSFGGLSVDLAT